MDGVVIHKWVFQQIDRNAEHRAGFFIETKEDDKGESLIVVRCRSKTNAKPAIRYYHCQNGDTCDLMRKCHQKDCHNPAFYHEDASKYNLIEDCEASRGCNGIVIRSLFLNGMLNVSCTGDGVNEHRVLKDVFFKDDIIRIGNLADEQDLSEQDYIHLSTMTHSVHSADQNPLREIQHIGANLEWELGETVEFSCVAAPFLYSSGIKWAVETKDGELLYQKDSLFDPQFKYASSTQVASTFRLLIDTMDYARVYCFVPRLGDASEWRNASMPIFIRAENSDDYCHETNSIHLINVHPSPSKLDLSLNETRLDKLPYYVVPQGVLQLAVKVSGPKPFSWAFAGSGDGPSRTPLIQSDRQVLDFYDSSTYCYSSRLLLNLRHKNPNDTGRYIVKHKYGGKELASFYIFVPSKTWPHLLNSGSTLNITLPEEEYESYYVPCLVNNPEMRVDLRFIDPENPVNITVGPYDPTRGFLVKHAGSNTSRVYHCVADRNEIDFLTVYAHPPKRTPELKYERVNDFHVFTCKSGNGEPPKIELIQLGKDGAPENTTEYKITRCTGGCVALITQAAKGAITCKGEGIDETYRFPPVYDGNQRRSDKNRTVGLSWDETESRFKCQMNSEEPPTLTAVTCRRPNECEIMKRRLQGSGDMSQATYSTCGEGCAQLQVRVQELSYTPPNWFSVFLLCKGADNMEILSQYYYDKGKMIYASRENAEQLKRIRIDVPALRRQGGKAVVTFRCFANRYFYSRGIQWGLEGRNGVLEFPPTAASQVEVQSFSAVMSTINLEVEEGEHTKVYCFVPLLDGPGWANSTMKLPVEQLQVNI